MTKTDTMAHPKHVQDIIDLVNEFTDQTDIDEWMADVRGQAATLPDDRWWEADEYLGPHFDSLGDISGRMNEIVVDHVEQTTFEIDQQFIRTQTMVGRATTLEKLGFMTSEKAAQIRALGAEATIKIATARKQILSELSKYNKAMHDAFNSMAISAEGWVHDKLDTDLDKLKQDLISSKEDFEKIKGAQRIAADEADKALEELQRHRTPENLEKFRIANEKSANATIKAKEAEKELNKLKNQVAIAGEKAARSLAGTGLKAAEKALDAAGISIKGIWSEINTMSHQFHTAGAEITEGFGRYLKSINGELEFDSALWAEARETTRGLAQREANGISKEISALRKLAELEDKSEFYAQAAKYMAPSSRMMILATEEFEEIRASSSWAWFTVRMMNPFFLLKQIGRTALAGAFKATEFAFGVEVAAAIVRVVGEVGVAAGSLISWVLGPEAAALMIAGEAAHDLFLHGFSWKFVDDLLGMFFLSLKQIAPGKALLEYPDQSKDIGGKNPGAGDPLKMHEYDWLELSSMIDFWGARYKKFMKRSSRHPKYKSYKKMAPFKAIQRVPGRYIDPRNHPFDTMQELEESQSIEKQLDADTLVGKDYISPSLVNQYYPKREGLVRNLANFPMYKKTYNWVDSDKGLPVVISGNFSESDLDTDIVNLFKYWATTGKFGPAFNGAKTRRQQKQVEEANKADLKQWMEMNPDWFLAGSELNQWIDSARGKRGVSAADMIILAPDDFNHEWSTDLPVHHFTFFSSQEIEPDGDHQYARKYEQNKILVGRYTYHPKDRKFLERAAAGMIMTATIQPLMEPAPPHVEALKHIDPYGSFEIYYLNERPATAGERQKYKEILDKGNEYRAELNRRKSMTQQEWDNFTVHTVWKSYVESEKPYRTLWGYISKYRQFFLQELMFVTMYLDGKNRGELWKEYMKFIKGRHVPLNMDSLYRTMFMGMFAQNAYSTTKKDAEKFHKTIEKRFEKILENDLVTTHHMGKKDDEYWMKYAKHIIETKVQVDWPVFFGDLNCRMFVLQKPHVVILAFKGTNSAGEWVIDMDFSMAEYIRVGGVKDGKVNYQIDTGATSAFDLLETDPNRFKVHRGFLRAWEGLKPGVIKQLEAYYEKYPYLEDVFITGHSLGAALTQLAALMIPRLPSKLRPTMTDRFRNQTIKTTYRNPHCFMYSSPLVGDQRFVRHFDSLTDETIQVWNDGDIITAAPPFLIPAIDTYASAAKSVIEVLESLGSKDEGMGAILFAFDQLMEHSSLEGWQTLSNLFKDAKGYNTSSVAQGAITSTILYNRHRPRRGGSTFMRLNEHDDRVSFDEAPEDIGNSSFLFEQIASGTNPFARMAKAHSMKTLLVRIAAVASKNPDLFNLDTKDWPKWADDSGDIRPKPKPKPKPRPGKDIPMDIERMLANGTAQVVGYAHTKHHHEPWQLVPKSDVDQFDPVWEVDDVVHRERIRHQNSIKRRRTDRHDPTYGGSDYI